MEPLVCKCKRSSSGRREELNLHLNFIQGPGLYDVITTCREPGPARKPVSMFSQHNMSDDDGLLTFKLPGPTGPGYNHEG